MFVVSRFHVPERDGGSFLDRAEPALAAFALCAGFQRGRAGRAADGPELWMITTEWESVGAFRRSLSTFGVKAYAAPLLAEAVEEPSAYESLLSVDAGAGTDAAGAPVVVRTASVLAADAGKTRVGESAVPTAPREPWDTTRR